MKKLLALVAAVALGWCADWWIGATAQERALAPVLYRVISGVRQTLLDGDDDFAALQAQAARELDANGLRTDYLEIRRAGDLGEPQAGDTELVVLAAAYLGKARLIDNIEVSR